MDMDFTTGLIGTAHTGALIGAIPIMDIIIPIGESAMDGVILTMVMATAMDILITVMDIITPIIITLTTIMYLTIVAEEIQIIQEPTHAEGQITFQHVTPIAGQNYQDV